MLKTVIVSVLTVFIVGACALGGLAWCSEHCGWETGQCH